jgi:hypothetical protein
MAHGKAKMRRWIALGLVIGMAVGVCLPSTCDRCVNYVGWLIGSNCWKALIQMEQLKEGMRMTQPAIERDRV